MRTHWAVVLLIGIVVSVLVSASPSYAGRLYWSRNLGDVGGDFENKLSTVRTDGSDFFELYLNVDDRLGAVVVDSASGRLYWIEHTFDGSRLVSGDPSGCRRLQTDNHVSGIALDVTGGKIYWTESDQGTGPRRIFRANLDLTSAELVLGGLSGGAREIAIDSPGGKMYWYAELVGEIMRSNLDGSNVEVQFEELVLQGMQIDSAEQKIYWAQGSTGGFRRADFDGANVEELASQVQRAWVVDTSGGTVYWRSDDAIPPFSSGLATISRADLDGSNEAIVLHSYEANASYLAFDPVDETITINCDVPTPALGLRSAGVLVLLLLGFGAWALKRS